LKIIALARHADRDPADAGPGVEPCAERPERAVGRRSGEPGEAGPLVVDLSDLHFAADAGKLKAQGARIIGARPYLSLRLAEGNDSIGGSR
jgi:hypothetical protein